ncbi:DUF7490 domain-containing protein [Halobacterium jilantaiense]|uniref:DUF7490 domain-containing protein n=1 Tax=Halobacterium jilantaiense TaxID=355548 RepID=A0A1I0QJP6_9EURY|nr:hypothetical protein [Halobacterium jilantaiense]SEW27340.1 hypothetical protein SAMN04487945_2672 [Halobacterium jilantaiense]
MDRERLLAVGIGVVVVASALAAVAIPGVVADTDREDVRPGRVDVEEVTIAADGTSSGTVDLSVTAYLDHRGGDSENVTVDVRAVGLDSGLVETTRSVDVDTISGDREVPVTVDVPVARDGGYRVETVLYADDQRVATVAKSVRGVGSVQAGGHVTFHRFGAGFPAVQYSVRDVDGNTTTLDVSTYLTNRGAEPSSDVSVALVVRQADSNVIAARTTVPVDDVDPGATVTPQATVDVPSEYNYYLDAILRKDGVVVDTARGAANLDPQERIEANTTVRDTGLRVEDFETTGGEQSEIDADGGGASGGDVPGFGPVVALLAVAAATILTAARRRSP